MLSIIDIQDLDHPGPPTEEQVRFEEEPGHMSGGDSGLEDAQDPDPPDPITYRDPEELQEPGIDPYRDATLFQCARNGYDDAAIALLQDDAVVAEIDAEDDEGLTPLHYACRYNHFNIIKLLVSKGAKVRAKDDEGLTPLHYACRIKRKRRKSHKSRAQLQFDDGDGPLSPKKLSEHQSNIDTNSSAIHFLIQEGAEILEKDEYGCSPLHHAALRGDEVAAEQLLMYRKDHTDESYIAKLVDATDNQKMTPLHTASCQCEGDIARQLLRAGADVTKTDEELSTPLHEAATSGDTRIAKFIFEACMKGDAMDSRRLSELLASKDEDGNTPLMLAVESARYKFAVHCINKGASLNSTNKWHMSALHLAAIKGDTRIVRLLLENGARVSALNYEHQTPLHKAALFNNTDAMVLLLDSGTQVEVKDTDEVKIGLRTYIGSDYDATGTALFDMTGAQVEAKDKDDFTPLLLAACYGHAEAVELLIKRNADALAEDKNDRTAVYLASEEDKIEALEVLLKYPQCQELINHRDENSNSPLHIAAGSGHIKIVKCLLNNNADIYVKNDLEQTPIHMAALNGCVDTVREIVKREKNAMSDGDEDSNTALHLAAMGGHLQLVQMLLTLGAEPEVRNSALKTPIGCAAAAGFTKTCKLLAAYDAQIDPIDKQKLSPLLAAASNGHSEVTDFLIAKNANVAFCDPDGNNCLDLAIKHDHQDVALEIVKSTAWRMSLRNVTIDKGLENTPMRKLIRKMPEVATEVFNRCIEVHKPEEGSQQKLLHKHEVTYDYEFIDDLYKVATEVFNRCIEVHKPEEGSQQKLLHRHEVTYDYEFIDDLYCIPAWKRMPKKRRQKDNSVEGEITKFMTEEAYNTWDPMDYFHRKDKSLVSYTRDSETFKKNHPLMIMVDSSREELLNHPLIKSMIDYKWRTFGRVLFYSSFVLYVIFVLSLTIYIGLTKPPFDIDTTNFASLDGSNECQKYESSGAKHNTLAAVTKYFVLVLAFLNIIKEIIQAIHLKIYYVQNGENVFEVLLFVTSILLTLDFETCQTVTGYRTDWQWNVGSIAVVLAWTNLVLFIQKFPEFGIYVVMFKSILLTFFKFYLVFQMFIIAFAMGFFCLLQNQEPFSTPWYSLIRTAVMMIGEFDYTDIFFGDDESHYVLTFVVFVIFLVVMPIIIMNLLVGLAVDDIKGVQEQAALKRIAMKVHSVLDTERASLSFTSRYFKESFSEQYDSIEEAVAATKATEEFENQIQKSQQKMLRKMDKVKHGLKGVKADITRIHEMLETIMKAQDIKNDQDDA